MIQTLEAAGPQAFAVTYDNYAGQDAMCCPSLPAVTITYRRARTAFQPQSAVPPGVYGLHNTHTHALTVELRPPSSPPQGVSAAAGASANAPWTADSLVITPTSLGAVKNGMTLAQGRATQSSAPSAKPVRTSSPSAVSRMTGTARPASTDRSRRSISNPSPSAPATSARRRRAGPGPEHAQRPHRSATS
jgi:hypothetical protein